MKKRKTESGKAPSLTVAFRQIVERLIDDDWYMASTKDGSRSYYVIGTKDQSALESEGAELSEFYPERSEVGLLEEWAARSQLADQGLSPRIAEARKKLEEAGVPSARIDSLLYDESDSEEPPIKYTVPPREVATLWSDFFDAVRIANSVGPLPEGVEDNELEVTREKVCLREIASKYPKILKWWSPFHFLTFKDPQIQEASKTRLFVFYRASIVLSASAIETQLKRLFPKDSEKTAKGLSERAHELGYLDESLKEFAARVFWLRNRVAHDNHAPLSDEAGEALDKSRKVVEVLHQIQGD
jgi:hypothetical protein